MSDKSREADWKIFRKLAPEARERYLKKLVAELAGDLQDETLTATERFWKAEEAIEKEAKTLYRCFDGHTRSKMFLFILEMFRSGVIVEGDLVGFSDELQNQIQVALNL